MKIFGSITELVKVIFRKDSKEVTLDVGTQAGTATSRTFRLPAYNSSSNIDDELVAAALAQTMSNKNLDSSTIRSSTRLDGAMVRAEGDAAGTPTLNFYKDGSAFKIAMSAPASLGSNINFVLPNGVGTNKYPLLTDGSGNTSWSQITNASVDASAGIVDTKLAIISTAGKVSNSATTATNLNTASAIVARDASGNFSAGTITATLTGNADTATTAGNVTGIVAGANGGTGVANTGKTITLGGNLTTSGAFATTLTSTATTSVTLPTTGTLATLAGTETLLNKTTVSSTGATTGALQLPAGNNTTDKTAIAATDGMIRYNTTNGAFEGRVAGAWSSIGGGGTTDTFTQASPVLAIGDVVYLNGSVYTKAVATGVTTAEVVGVISKDPSILGTDKYEITLSGEISGLTGLTTGEVYFLSAGTAGALTTTEPSVIGQVSVPVGIASSTTTLYVAPKRGAVVGGTNARTELPLTNNGSTTIYTAPAGLEAGEITGWVYLNATTDYRFFVRAQFAKNGLDTDWNISAQTTGDTPPAGYAISISSGGVISLALPNLAGFVSAKINYALNAPAVGATFPLAVDASTITTGTVSSSNLPVAGAAQAGIVSLSNQSMGAGDKYFSGNVGIGTTSPDSNLHIKNAAGNAKQTLESADGSMAWTNYSAQSNEFSIGWVRTSGSDSSFRFCATGDLNSNERMRIDGSGNLLVGTTNPLASAGNGFKVNGTSLGYVATVSTSSVPDTYNYFNSTVGAYRFYVTNAGTIFATSTTISAISDQRLKENVRDLDDGLNAVMSLKPRKFDWKEGKGKDIKDDRGFIAQEFEQVFPDMVQPWKDPAPEGEEPYRSVNANLIPTLVKAIQELKAELDATKAELAAVKEQLDK